MEAKCPPARLTYVLVIYCCITQHSSATQNSTDLGPRVPRGRGIMSPVFRQFWLSSCHAVADEMSVAVRVMGRPNQGLHTVFPRWLPLRAVGMCFSPWWSDQVAKRKL